MADDTADNHQGIAGEQPARQSPHSAQSTPDPFAGPEWTYAREPRTDPAGGGATRQRVRVRKVPLYRRLLGRRRRESDRPRSRRARVLRWSIGVLALLIVLSVGWLLYSGLRVRSELRSVRAEVHVMRQDLTSGDLAGARKAAASVRQHANSAHSLTGGPVWDIAAAVPGLGKPFTTVRSIASSVQLVADGAVDPLIESIGTFQPDQLRTASGAFNLKVIQRLGPAVDSATGALHTALSRLHGAAGSTWIGSVDQARTDLITELTPLESDLGNIGRAVRVVPTVLGANGPRTYMMSFENDAELRATGGIPGAFAIVRADQGKLSFTHFEPDTFFSNVEAKGLHFGPDFTNLYQTAQEDYRDSDYSPNFPYAAQIWARMWQQKTGGTIDGALIVDPTALKYLLAVSGPVTLSDGSRISAGNIVELTQKTLYARYPSATQNAQRKAYLLKVAKGVSQRLLLPGVNSGHLLRAAGKAAAENRLLFWSADPAVEKELQTVPLGGVVPDDSRPYLAVGLNNDSQSKLDYYLSSSMTYTRVGCGQTREVTVALHLTNNAPAELPAYVEGGSFPVGTERLDVALYATKGARFTKVLAGGAPPFHLDGVDRGHPVYNLTTTIPRGETTTIIYHLTEPAGTGPVQVRTQPMINPMTVNVNDGTCR